MHQIWHPDLCRGRVFLVHPAILLERQQFWRSCIHLVREPDQRMGHDKLVLLHDHLHSLQKSVRLSQRTVTLQEHPTTIWRLDCHGRLLAPMSHQWLYCVLPSKLVGFLILDVLCQHSHLLRYLLRA